MPDKITIFQGPHERLSRTRAQLEQMVAETVWHEIAHHFGMDEARVRRAGAAEGTCPGKGDSQSGLVASNVRPFSPSCGVIG